MTNRVFYCVDKYPLRLNNYDFSHWLILLCTVSDCIVTFVVLTYYARWREPVFKIVISCFTPSSPLVPTPSGSDIYFYLWLVIFISTFSKMCYKCFFLTHFNLCLFFYHLLFYNTVVFHCCVVLFSLSKIQLVYLFYTWWAVGYIPISMHINKAFQNCLVYVF